MENISVLTDFPESDPKQYYKKIATPGEYTLYTGGNFFYVTNAKNRTVRFTSNDMRSPEVTETQISGWLERIHHLFPQF